MPSRRESFSKVPAVRLAFRRLLVEEDGAALVEATIIAPILVAMGIYAAGFGLLFYTKMQVQNAAQAGAQWAMANRVYNSSSIQVAAQNATPLPAAGTSACTADSPACVAVTSSQFCGCSIDSSGNVAVTQLSAGSCTSPAPGATCNTSGVAGNYVTVTARTPSASPHKSFVTYGLISSTYDIITATTARIQ
jgi:Flp pilus assembly protein TadG